LGEIKQAKLTHGSGAYKNHSGTPWNSVEQASACLILIVHKFKEVESKQAEACSTST
jgi:hypothetical protein